MNDLLIAAHYMHVLATTQSCIIMSVIHIRVILQANLTLGSDMKKKLKFMCIICTHTFLAQVYTTPCLKKCPTFGLLQLCTCEQILRYFFGRNVTDKVRNQKTLQYATSNNLCFCRKREHCFFPSNAVLVHCLNSTVTKPFWLTTHTDTTVWLSKSCNQRIQLWSVGDMIQEKGSRFCCSSWTVLHAQCTCALPSWFPILQGNAEAPDRWGGKTKHLFIWFLTFSVTLLPKIIIIGSWMSRL